jgi:hypothetical protein
MRKLLRFILAGTVVSVVFTSNPCRAQKPPAAGWTQLVPRVDGANHYFVAPDGKAGNAGTENQPWDLGSTLAGQHQVQPGDVIWVRGGTYKGKHTLKLAGKEGAPLHIRGMPGQRATILDGTLFVAAPTSHVWLWDLEITTSTPAEQRTINERGSWPKLPATFADGVGIVHTQTAEVYKDLKLINLVIHDTAQGVSFWIDAVDSEIHGCLIYDNGWNAPDRGHGHSIYTQNKEGIKTISNNIMSAKFNGAYTLHAYGSSKAYVDNYVVEDNIAYDNGPVLVGGGRPSHNIKVRRNYLYGVSMRLGYGAANEDCEVQDNIIAKGSLRIDRFNKVVQENNLQELPQRKVVLIPNKYDPNRAHLAIYNGAKATEVPLDASSFLKPGDRFRLMGPKDFYGRPLQEGTASSEPISVPMNGEFAAFVILKGA